MVPTFCLEIHGPALVVVDWLTRLASVPARTICPAVRPLKLTRGFFVWGYRGKVVCRCLQRLRAIRYLCINAGARFMWCYFLLDGRIAGVEALPPGLSDKDAIVRANIPL
jgi:hypothetical protein